MLYLRIRSLIMPKGGLEPPRVSSPPPQDGVSTNSTTSAYLNLYHPIYSNRIMRRSVSVNKNVRVKSLEPEVRD